MHDALSNSVKNNLDGSSSADFVVDSIYMLLKMSAENYCWVDGVAAKDMI